MEGGSSGKRRRSGSEYDKNGDSKRRNAPGDREVMPGADDTVYRILCPGAKIGSVIGKGGSIIKSLRSETRAKIKVADGIPGVDERVIIVFSAAKERTSQDEGDENVGAGDDRKFVCPAQDALFRIHSRIVEDDGIQSDEDEDGENKVVVRLLVPNNQIGCLLGKGGKVIEKMRTETSAQIKILPKEHLPACAMHTDELVQISGPPAIVKNALYEISIRLHENPPRERLPISISVPSYSQNPYLASAGHLFPSSGMVPPGGASIVGMPTTFSTVGGYGGDAAGAWSMHSIYAGMGGSARNRRDESAADEFLFQMLCKNDKIGFIIGKGGSAINQLRQETGANIKVAEQLSDCDERVIFISAKEYADDPVSPTLDAVLQLQMKASDRLSDESKEGVITTRFLVPTNHIGCILGKGGSIITELRKRTRANIRIMSKDDLPKCASENDELVQIVGEVDIARDALIQITKRLRANVFKDKEGSAVAGLVVPSAFPYPGFGAAHSPGNMYPLSTLDYQGSASGRYSAGGYGTYGSLNGASSMYGPMSSYPTTGHVGSGGSGFTVNKNASGSSIEMTVPNKAVGSILGRGGQNISQIREISGAKVKLHESKPGSNDRIVEISGTPEQTQAAQNLLQAYVMNGGQCPRTSRAF